MCMFSASTKYVAGTVRAFLSHVSLTKQPSEVRIMPILQIRRLRFRKFFNLP